MAIKKVTSADKGQGTKVKKVTKTVASKTTAVKIASKKEVVAATIPVKKEKRKTGDMSMEVLSPEGKSVGNITLPEIYFGAKVNPILVAQAIRVYLANQREGSASTKTRGEVEGSTKKIFRQKGTGRARHGGIRAPIFVGGGISMGPRPHSHAMAFPHKMKQRALASVLTTQLRDGAIKVVGDVESLPLKTKSFATMFSALSCTGKTLFFLSRSENEMARAVQNLERVHVRPVNNATTYEVLNHKHIVFTKNAIEELGKITQN